MGPGVLELSNLAAGKFLGLGNVTVRSVCDMSCPFSHLTYSFSCFPAEEG